MNETVKPAPAGMTGKAKIAGMVGIGCVVLACLLIVLAVAGFLGYQYFFTGDPTAAITPQDAIVYSGFDFVKMQSKEVLDIVSVFQKVGDLEEDKTPIEILDDSMMKQLGLSFTKDILPWVGTHGGYVITDAKLGTSGPQNVEFMFVLEVRDTKKADEFLQKFIGTVEDQSNGSFEKRTVDGVSFYIMESEYEDPRVMARIGNFMYLANSQDAIIKSATLKRGASLADLPMYKKVLQELPSNRLATMYISKDGYEALTSMATSAAGSASTVLNTSTIPEGTAMSITADANGLRIDYAIGYDEKKLTDFERANFAVQYRALATASLAPEETFFFVGTNSTIGSERWLDKDSPLYTKDVDEALALMEKQYGIDLRKLSSLLGSEVSLAIAPDKNQLAGQELYFGLTLMADVKNEEEFNRWFKETLDSWGSKTAVEFKTRDIAIGSYQLNKASTESSGEEVSFFYGAGKGHLFISSSEQMLDKGLNNSQTLANNPAYKKAMSAFSGNSTPYMYINIGGLLDAYEAMAPYASEELAKICDGADKIPAIAAALNKPSNYILGGTWIIFVDTGK